MCCAVRAYSYTSRSRRARASRPREDGVQDAYGLRPQKRPTTIHYSLHCGSNGGDQPGVGGGPAEWPDALRGGAGQQPGRRREEVALGLPRGGRGCGLQKELCLERQHLLRPPPPGVQEESSISIRPSRGDRVLQPGRPRHTCAAFKVVLALPNANAHFSRRADLADLPPSLRRRLAVPEESEGRHRSRLIGGGCAARSARSVAAPGSRAQHAFSGRPAPRAQVSPRPPRLPATGWPPC